jgi:hypothetical protein
MPLAAAAPALTVLPTFDATWWKWLLALAAAIGLTAVILDLVDRLDAQDSPGLLPVGLVAVVAINYTAALFVKAGDTFWPLSLWRATGLVVLALALGIPMARKALNRSRYRGTPPSEVVAGLGMGLVAVWITCWYLGQLGDSISRALDPLPPVGALLVVGAATALWVRSQD